MKCPTCKTDMECLPGNRYRRDAFYDIIHFHCVNDQCLARLEANYISHMSIISYTWPYNVASVGVCWEYHLPFKIDEQWYYLIGQQEAFRGTIMRASHDPKPIMLVDFLYINADDTMHWDAWRVCMRLKNLLVFT